MPRPKSKKVIIPKLKPKLEKNNKVGRDTIVIDWERFDYLCKIHCTLNEISGFFGCSEDTIERRVMQAKKLKFAEYYRQKSMHGKIAIRRALFQGLENGRDSITIWLSKQHLGMSDQPEIREEEETKLNLDKWK